ncbi:MAG: hypothetical protein ACR2KM_04155 [Gemmatimonadaceae bacterium]
MADENEAKDLPEPVQAALAKLIEKSGGDSGAVAMKLWDDNHSYRERNRALKADVERLTGEVNAAKKPADDATAALEAYKAYGTPDELKAKLERGAQLDARITAEDRDKLAREAAGLVGYNADTLSAIVADKSLTLELKDETVDGKPAKVPYVKPPKDGENQPAPVKLTDYAEQKLAPYVSALQTKPAGTAPPGTTTTYPSQRPSGRAPTTANPADTVQAGLKSRYPTPSERRSGNSSMHGSTPAQGG